MLEHRVMPCLLLQGRGLVKTVKFASPRYIGDAINAVRIFNDKLADELVFLDIAATHDGRGPNFELLAAIASEAFMPLGYGGGVRSASDAERLFKLGVEKVVVNTILSEKPSVLAEIVSVAGSASVVASVDVARDLLGRYIVKSHGGKRTVSYGLTEWLRRVEAGGAGEVLLQSIERDGTMRGYDLKLIASAAAAIGLPLVAAGGAGELPHLSQAIAAGAAAVAAGSLFVYYGRHRAVLLTYPETGALRRLFA
jgi:cyclase